VCLLLWHLVRGIASVIFDIRALKFVLSCERTTGVFAVGFRVSLKLAKGRSEATQGVELAGMAVDVYWG